MKVYGFPMSTCTRKVLTVLHEKGHEAQFVVVDLMKGEHKGPDHLARQPFGVIPVLDDDGFMLYESRAICRYLDSKLAGISLTPTDIKARAMMDQWMSIEQSYFGDPVVKIMYQRLLLPMQGKPSDEALVETSRASVSRTLDVADKTLAQHEYLAGSTFSLADVCWMPYAQTLFMTKCGDLITERPHVAAWWKRVSTRPSWVKITG